MRFASLRYRLELVRIAAPLRFMCSLNFMRVGVLRVKDLAIGVTIATRNEAPIMQQHIFAVAVVLAGFLGLMGYFERE